MNRLLALLALLALAAPAWGQTYAPGIENHRVARFPSGASAVTVDVYEVNSATQVGDDIAATVIEIDEEDSDAWTFDLAAVAGYPVDCTPTDYVLRWNPDASNCSAEDGTPALCFLETVHVGGPECETQGKVQVEVTKTTVPNDAQGITQGVIDYYARRGERVQRWRKISTSYDGDFSSPVAVKWEVFFYRSSAESVATPFSCGKETTSNPANLSDEDLTALGASCSGN